MEPVKSPIPSILSKVPSDPASAEVKITGHAASSFAKQMSGEDFIAIDAPVAPYALRSQALQGMLAGGVTSGAFQQPVVRRLAGQVAESLGQFGVGVAATSLLQRSSSQKTGSDFVRGQLLHSAVTGLWAQLIAAYKERVTDLPQRMQRIHALLMSSDHKTVQELPKALQHRLRQIDFEIAASIRSENFEAAEVMMGRRQGILLSFPQLSLPLRALPLIEISESQALHFKKIDANVDCLLQDYRHIPKLDGIVKMIRLHSLMNPPPHRVQLFLHGAGGVGKTHFVRRLRDALGLPLFETTLQGEKASELLGVRNGLSAPANYALRDSGKTDASLLTLIPFAMTSTGYKNSLVFCDEASEAVNVNQDSRHGFYGGGSVGADGLKQFFSPDNVEIDSSALIPGLKYDFRHATVILAGNEAPRDAALAQRFEIIRFPDLPPAQKQKAAERSMLATVKAIPGLASSVQADVMRDAGRYFSEVLDLDKQHKVEGARLVQRAMSQVVEALLMGLFENKPVSYDDVMEGVKRVYQNDQNSRELSDSDKPKEFSGVQVFNPL